jgi:Protein of unknown function (DUF3617)
MKRTLLLVLAAASGTALAQGVGPKAGLWDWIAVRQVFDGREMKVQSAAARSEMQQKALAHMTPEQRKQMEAMMNSQAAAPTGGTSYRVCVSAAMAARNKLMFDPRGRCEPNKVSRSGDKTTFEFDCTRNGFGTAGKGESIVAGDTISTSVDTTITDPRGRHTMHSETQMKYLGQDCQGVKPLDELSKQFPSAAGVK